MNDAPSRVSRAATKARFRSFIPVSLDRRKIRVMNVSKNGLGLVTSTFVSPGTIVQLRVGNTLEVGEVRHCLARGGEYYTGLRLQRDA
jgi:hypothetical protein